MKKFFTAKIRTVSTYTVFFAAVFLCLLFVLKPVLAGWEFHSPLVRYTPDFFAMNRSVPVHTLLLANNFLAQFAYYPALGALLCALLFCATAFTANVLAGFFTPATEEQPKPRPLLPGFATAALLLPCFANTFCTWPLIFLSTLTSGIIWHKTNACNAFLRIPLRAILLVLLTFFLREYTLLAAALFTAMETACAVRTVRAGNPTKSTVLRACLRIVLAWAGIIAAGIAFHRLWFPYHFFDKGSIWILLFPAGTVLFEMPFRCFYTPVFAVIMLWISCLVAAALPFVHHLNRLPSRLRYAFVGLGLAAVILPLVTLNNGRTRDMKTFFRADALMREWKWDEALEVLDADFERQASGSISQSFLNYTAQLKCALLATRKATEKIFSYKHPVFPALFPKSIHDGPESYILSVYYAYTGMFAEALHANYDWITAGRLSPAVLNELVRTELIYNNSVAAKHTYLLQSGLFRGREAEKTYSQQTVRIRRELERARTLMSSEDFGIEAYVPDANLFMRGYRQQQNLYFYEYFMTLLLIHKDYETITSDFNRLRVFYPSGLPRLIQEALLANFNYSPDRIDYPLHPQGISPEVMSSYWDFLMDEHTYRTGGMDFIDFMEKWHQTFWFYHLYMYMQNERYEF